MTIYDLKPAFQNLLRPACSALARHGVTANQVTLVALAGSFAVGFLVARYPESSWVMLAFPVWLFVRMALNAIDGMLAREHGMKSSLGSLLNELGDVFSDAALYLPFAFVPGIEAHWVVALVLLSTTTEIAGLAAVQIGASRRYDGPLGKSDRAFLFGVIALLLAFGVKPETWLNLVFALACVLAVATVLNRCRKALKEVT